MIPILYDYGESAFATSGMGRLIDCISCRVTEERNGIYECEFEYPVSGRMYDQIVEGRSVGCTHDDTGDIQPFDIYGRSAVIDGVVTFYAHHISYRLRHVILRPFEAGSCAATLARFATETYTPNPFGFWTDKTVNAPYKLSAPASVREMLVGTAGSVLDVYGTGEYQFDKFLVRLYTRRGRDSGVKIRYGLNLIDLTQDIDTSGVYNTIIPFWRSSDDDTLVMLPEIMLSGPHVQIDQIPWTTDAGEYMQTGTGEPLYWTRPNVTAVPLDMSDSFDEQPTVEQLRAAAQSRINNSAAYRPRENITVDFVALWQTAEYASIAPLQRLALCDRATVQHPELGVNVSMQIIRTTYNVLEDRFDEMELGDAPRTSYADTIAEAMELTVLPKYASRSMLDASVHHATEMITGGLGGYVVFNRNADGQPEELLIMDTPDIATAVNVWRFNRGGLGHSHSGYNGPYNDVALTADGKINASMITAGTLNANIIRAGVIADVTGKNSWDLFSGSFAMTGGTIDLEPGAASGGLHIGPYGDLAIGGKPPQMGIMDNNTTPLQIVRNGMVKCVNLSIYGRISDNANYTKYGSIDGTTWYRDNQDIAGLLITSPNRQAHVGINDTGVYVLGLILNSNGDYAKTNGVYDGIAGASAFGVFDGDTDALYFYMSRKRLRFDGNVSIGGTLSVDGAKNRAVNTATHGRRRLYAYETAAPYFGDIGEAQINQDGRVVVHIDPVFAETIVRDGYQVSLTPYGRGECFVGRRDPGSFVVEGTAGLRFGWHIMGRQIDYPDTRLEVDDNDN